MAVFSPLWKVWQALLGSVLETSMRQVLFLLFCITQGCKKTTYWFHIEIHVWNFENIFSSKLRKDNLYFKFKFPAEWNGRIRCIHLVLQNVAIEHEHQSFVPSLASGLLLSVFIFYTALAIPSIRSSCGMVASGGSWKERLKWTPDRVGMEMRWSSCLSSLTSSTSR